MDQILGKAGSYFFAQKANKEIAVVSNEINAVSNSIEGGTKWLVSKIKGKMQKPLPELLKEHDLPGGLFPGNNLTDYDFNDKTGLLTLELSNPWEVQYGDSSLLRFNTEVSGYLEKGKMTNVEGMKTKMVMMWVKVTLISAEGSDKVQFTAGMKKSRSREAYEALREGVAVDKF